MLALLSTELGRDVAVGLARTAKLARSDADLLDELAELALTRAARGDALDVAVLVAQPDALRGRMLLSWLRNHGCLAGQVHVAAVDDLVVSWRGQGPVLVPGGSVRRISGRLEWLGLAT